jgi:hypothetical protein
MQSIEEWGVMGSGTSEWGLFILSVPQAYLIHCSLIPVDKMLAVTFQHPDEVSEPSLMFQVQ